MKSRVKILCTGIIQPIDYNVNEEYCGLFTTHIKPNQAKSLVDNKPYHTVFRVWHEIVNFVLKIFEQIA